MGSITLRKLFIRGSDLEKVVQSLRRSITQLGGQAIEVTQELTLGDFHSIPSAAPQIQRGLFEVFISLKSVTTLTCVFSREVLVLSFTSL